ncbi:MAG: hypothetical protein ACR2LI_02735 [Propionibacteriaceae bacterium]
MLEGRGGDAPGGPELLDSGPPPSPGRRGLLLGLLGVVVLVLVGFSLTAHRDDPSVMPPPSPSPPVQRPTWSVSPTVSATPGPTGSATRPVVTRGSGPLAPGLDLGVLYAYGSSTLFAIDVASGDVRRTDGVELGSTAPVELAPTADGLVLRSLDAVPGVIVRVGRGPAALTGLLRSSDAVLPGPDGHVWVGTYGERETMRLVDGRGQVVGPTVTATGSFGPDGRGGLLLSDVGGMWQAYPGPLRRITIGVVTAVGPRHYRLTECDDAHRCWDEIYLRSTGERRRLGRAQPVFESVGLISPDGRFAVSVLHRVDGATTSRVARLSDGKVVHSFTDPPDGYGSSPQFAVWLTSRWLAVLQDGRLVLYDSATQQVRTPELSVRLTGLAWRPAR